MEKSDSVNETAQAVSDLTIEDKENDKSKSKEHIY